MNRTGQIWEIRYRSLPGSLPRFLEDGLPRLIISSLVSHDDVFKHEYILLDGTNELDGFVEHESLERSRYYTHRNWYWSRLA